MTITATCVTRADVRDYVGYAVDDALNPRALCEIPQPDTHVRYIGWQCGFEPLFVAVWSHLPDTRLDADEAVGLATDLLAEKGWFAATASRTPDYVL
jgi:hypothetical protein